MKRLLSKRVEEIHKVFHCHILLRSDLVFDSFILNTMHIFHVVFYNPFSVVGKLESHVAMITFDISFSLLFVFVRDMVSQTVAIQEFYVAEFAGLFQFQSFWLHIKCLNLFLSFVEFLFMLCEGVHIWKTVTAELTECHYDFLWLAYKTFFLE